MCSVVPSPFSPGRLATRVRPDVAGGSLVGLHQIRLAGGHGRNRGTETPAPAAAWSSPTAALPPNCGRPLNTVSSSTTSAALPSGCATRARTSPGCSTPPPAWGGRVPPASKTRAGSDARGPLRRRQTFPMGYGYAAYALPQPGSLEFPDLREHVVFQTTGIMNQLWLTAKARYRRIPARPLVPDLHPGLRRHRRPALFVFGLTESRVLGFIGLSRLLVTYIQLTMAILPIFVLITTVRSVAGIGRRRLRIPASPPVSLSAWFWGKIVGRYIVVFAPVFLAMLAAVGWATLRGNRSPLGHVRLLHRPPGGNGRLLPGHRHAHLGPRPAAPTWPRAPPSRLADPFSFPRPSSPAS